MRKEAAKYSRPPGTLPFWQVALVSVAVTTVLSVIMSLAFHGHIRIDYMVTGTICALLVPLAINRTTRIYYRELVDSISRYELLFDSSSDAIALIDAESGRIVDVNPAWLVLYGYTRDEALDLAADALCAEGMPASMENISGIRWHLRKDGTRIAMELSSGVAHWQRRRMICMIGRDVSARRAVEERLRLAASVFEHAHEGIAITDAQACIIDVNETFERITGYTRDEVEGKNPSILSSGRQGPEFYAEMWRAIGENGFWRGEIWNRRKDGAFFAEMLTISAVRDDAGQVTNFVGICSDITRMKEQEQHLQRLAHYDALTGLPNRVLLADRMRQAMAHAKRSRSFLAICYLDLDGFKPVNDHHGHEAGDQVLGIVAERLRATIRGGDTAARLGGDEFAVLLGGLRNTRECHEALKRVIAVLGAPYIVAGQALDISASIGVTLFPVDDGTADTLLRHADMALYQAKQGGRNRYVLFDPEDDRRVVAHHQALAEIEAAFSRGEFSLHYQPKLNMRDGAVIGAEALIRWQHPERGLLLPAAFLPMVDNTEFDVVLGSWVIEEAVRQLDAWLRHDGIQVPVSVNINVSARQLQQNNFAANLAAILRRYPSVQPGFIELEVVESTALEDLARIGRIIEECRDIGVSFALDDFGTGYSSLTYLKHLPASTLKIDQSFVRDMLDDPEARAIIAAIIGLAETFGRRVIAEGVETAEHGRCLLEMGCDLAQGFHIARPMPPEELPAWMAAYVPDPLWGMEDSDMRRVASADF